MKRREMVHTRFGLRINDGICAIPMSFIEMITPQAISRRARLAAHAGERACNRPKCQPITVFQPLS